jgi:hypothetical protein
MRIEVKLSKEEVHEALLEYARRHKNPVAVGNHADVLLKEPTLVFKEGDEYWQSDYTDGMIAIFVYE